MPYLGAASRGGGGGGGAAEALSLAVGVAVGVPVGDPVGAALADAVVVGVGSIGAAVGPESGGTGSFGVHAATSAPRVSAPRPRRVRGSNVAVGSNAA